MVDRFYTRGCDNLVGVSVYISLINFGHKIYLMITKLWYNIRMTIIEGAIHESKYGSTRVFASTYTAKQLKTIYYSLIESWPRTSNLPTILMFLYDAAHIWYLGGIFQVTFSAALLWLVMLCQACCVNCLTTGNPDILRVIHRHLYLWHDMVHVCQCEI